MNKYIICVNSSYIRDAQILDQNEWKDIFGPVFLGVIEASNAKEALKLASEEYDYGCDCLEIIKISHDNDKIKDIQPGDKFTVNVEIEGYQVSMTTGWGPFDSIEEAKQVINMGIQDFIEYLEEINFVHSDRTGLIFNLRETIEINGEYFDSDETKLIISKDLKSWRLSDDEELELTDEQLARNDDIDNAIYDMLLVLTEKNEEEFPWNMEHIGNITMMIEDYFEKRNIHIRHPGIITDEDGNQYYAE